MVWRRPLAPPPAGAEHRRGHERYAATEVNIPEERICISTKSVSQLALPDQQERNWSCGDFWEIHQWTAIPAPGTTRAVWRGTTYWNNDMETLVQEKRV